MDRRIAVIAGILTIFAFITGIFSLPQLFQSSTDPERSTLDETPSIPTDIPPTIASQLITGSGTLWYELFGSREGFSFSEGQVTVAESGDFYFYPSDGPALGTHAPDSGILDLGPVNFEDVKEAPINSKYKRYSVKVVVGHTYCISLQDGHFFAKLKVTSCIGDSSEATLRFEYAFQQNGTRFLY
jgi:hypothetical protein